MSATRLDGAELTRAAKAPIVYHGAPIDGSRTDRPLWSGVTAALLRPDGYVAWTSMEASADRLGSAIEKAVAAIGR